VTPSHWYGLTRRRLLSTDYSIRLNIRLSNYLLKSTSPANWLHVRMRKSIACTLYVYGMAYGNNTFSTSIKHCHDEKCNTYLKFLFILRHRSLRHILSDVCHRHLLVVYLFVIVVVDAAFGLKPDCHRASHFVVFIFLNCCVILHKHV